MASFVSTNGYVSIGAVNLSAYIKSFKMTDNREIKDATAHGDAARRRLSGLADWELTVEPYSDEAASRIQATIWPLRGTQFAVAVRPVNAAIAATNPEYQGNGMLESFDVVAGDVGEVAMAPLKIVCSDGVALIRDTTP